ncbi:hypothetical protein GJ633_12095 [Halorubrum sp. CBA1125]|uniref:hypothetical protein n=1 Tax=Halorubrum sp. CBA1125 TaxID=2668072 RepID=UPI0012E82D5B|nr:hypothetical protein [Halorubrum sp. CBA1125]MUW15306.1 hypothetical protein [Halorubrum sp. CBA1125]
MTRSDTDSAENSDASESKSDGESAREATSAVDGGGPSATLRQLVLGEVGFERAAVWSAVGFALSYVAVDAGALAGVGVVPTAIGLAGLTALGAIAFAATDGGALPSALLAAGPFSAVLLRAIGPDPYAIPVADPGRFLVTVGEPIGIALATAVGVGVVAAALGRALGGRLA